MKRTPNRAPSEQGRSRNFFQLALALSVIGLAKLRIKVSMPWRRRR